MDSMYIYKLECIKNGKVYIGRTICPSRRKTAHMSKLRCGKHSVKLMQADYDKYGESAFVFTVLEIVARITKKNERGTEQYLDSLREKELMLQYKSYLPEHGYNYNDQYFHPVLKNLKKYALAVQ